MVTLFCNHLPVYIVTGGFGYPNSVKAQVTGYPKGGCPPFIDSKVACAILRHKPNLLSSRMPLSIRKSGKGYKVTDPEGHKYSKKPKSKKAAIAQMVAIEYAKKRRRG